MVPVDEADEAEDEESLGDVGLRLTMSSWSSSRSSNWRGSGGRRFKWLLANDLCKSLMVGGQQDRTDKAPGKT